MPSADTLAAKFEKLPERDQRVLEKIIDKMIDWNITLPRAIANVNVFFQPSGGDLEFDSFEKSLDRWIDLGERYG